MNSSFINPPVLKPGNHPTENEFGETSLPHAPITNIDGGPGVVAQQFLDVNRSLQSVEAILSQLTLPEKFMLFAGEENGIVYLVCGVVGSENYAKKSERDEGLKIVYGRRWLLEPTTPTSEVIQTALLAVKKAREHELRERIVLRLPKESPTIEHVSGSASVRQTTPFNCHMDLPLMAQKSECFTDVTSTDWNVCALLDNLKVDNMTLSLIASHQLGKKRVAYDISINKLKESERQFTDLEGRILTVVCEKGTRSEFLHELFAIVLRASDSYVDEVFSFRKFARFGQDVCPVEIAKFSCHTRKAIYTDSRFQSHFTQMSYRVDSAKAPTINNGKLGEQQQRTLQCIEEQYGLLSGYLPHGYSESSRRKATQSKK